MKYLTRTHQNHEDTCRINLDHHGTFPCHCFEFFSAAVLIREALARAEEESGDLLLWSRISSMLSPRVLFFLRKQAFCEVIQFLSVERDERGSLDATTHVPVVYGSVNTSVG